MNKLLTVLILLILSTPTIALEKDKQMHIAASTAISSLTYVATENWKISFGACMAVGVAKEVMDEVRYGGFDTEDIAANAIGCIVGIPIGKTLVNISNNSLTFSRKF